MRKTLFIATLVFLSPSKLIMRMPLLSTILFLVPLLRLPAIAGAQVQDTAHQASGPDSELVQILGTGKVKSVQPIPDRREWIVDIEAPEPLRGQIAKRSIRIEYSTRPGGTCANQDWVGKMIYFEAFQQDGVYRAGDFGNGWSDFSPDGKFVYVWPQNTDATLDIKAIKRVAAICPATTEGFVSHAVQMVEDESMPVFLRKRLMEYIWGYSGPGKEKVKKANHQRFLSWRDAVQFPLTVRIEADFYLESPSYEQDADHLKFLSSVTTSPLATEWEKQAAQMRLKEATASQ